MAKITKVRNESGQFVKGHGKIPRNRIILTCKECGSLFSVFAYQAKFRKYCSCKCNARTTGRVRKGKTLEEMFGDSKAKLIREQLSNTKRGKRYPQISEAKRGKIPKNLTILHTPEVRRKISEALRGHHTSPETEFGKNNPAPVYYKDTKIELAIKDGLILKQIQGWTTHLSILGICKPDFIFPQEKVAIFCDGDYWHNKPNVRERDRRINRTLKENGWAVLRFWEHEINENPDKCIYQIRGVVQCA